MAESRLPKRSKSFSSADVSSEAVEVAPLGFDIAGQEFEVLPEIPGIVLLDFIESTTSDVKGASATALVDFLKDVMTTEEWNRFDAVLRNPANRIDIKTITEIVGYLVAEYSGRPTEAS